jgi:hypothetical protein
MVAIAEMWLTVVNIGILPTHGYVLVVGAGLGRPPSTKVEVCYSDTFYLCTHFLYGKVETPYHDNNLILTPIISPQSGRQ